MGLGLTVAWVGSVLLHRFVLGRARGAFVAAPVGLVLVGLSAAGLAAAAIVYARGPGPLSADAGAARRAAIRAWSYLLGTGLGASLGYMLTGQVLCFSAGLLALLGIHWLAPDRLRARWERAA